MAFLQTQATVDVPVMMENPIPTGLLGIRALIFKMIEV